LAQASINEEPNKGEKKGTKKEREETQVGVIIERAKKTPSKWISEGRGGEGQMNKQIMLESPSFISAQEAYDKKKGTQET
jgi:hypothetical protein